MNTNNLNNMNLGSYMKDTGVLSNVHPISSNWAVNNRSPNGVRPPQPYLDTSYQKYSTLPEPSPQVSYNLLRINSQREPFATQYLVNGYGGMNTRLGTTMGTK